MAQSRALRGAAYSPSPQRKALRSAAFRLADCVEQEREQSDGEAALEGILDLVVLLEDRGIYDLYDGGKGRFLICRSSDGAPGAWAKYSAMARLYVVGAFYGALAVASDHLEAAALVPGYGPTSLTTLCWSPEWARFQEELQDIEDEMSGGER